LPKQDARLTQIENGIRVASVENYSPITQVGVVVKAGSRYENPKENLGIAHCLRNAAVYSTENHTAFSLTRNLEVRGAKLCATGTRDYLIYTLKCSRDEVDSGLEILSEVTNKQVFKPWEVSDGASNLHIDVAAYHNNPTVVLNEMLHTAAFRGGLSNSLFSPSWMIEKHNSEMLHHFVEENFTTLRTSVVALGMHHDHLQESVNNLFNLHDRSTNSTCGASKFVPGECRQEADINQVHAAIVAEGSGVNNAKETLSLGVLECILGTGSQIKLCAPKFTPLGKAAAKSTNNPFYANCLNINYADTGLFGVYVSGSPEDIGNIIKSVVSEMKQVAKNITEESVEVAKHQLKAKLLFERESSHNALIAMAVEASEFGQIKDVKDIMKSIEALKASDVQSVAARVMKAKPAMAAIGRLYATPHVDELI